MSQKFEQIDNYGVIGNLSTVALVSLHGSIDFLCAPYFDAPTVFAALLDQQDGGCFSIHPRLKNINYKQLYLTDSAVLVTRFFSEEGIAEVMDFMAIEDNDEQLTIVRKLTAIKGDISFDIECCPRFAYSKLGHQLTAKSKGNYEFISDEGERLYLRSEFELPVRERDINGTIKLKEGQSGFMILSNQDGIGSDGLHVYCSGCFSKTFSFWKDWVDQCSYNGRWLETMRRSAITLKLLTCKKHGSVVAAPTFGLPETIGGERNWDYRYVWIRDAAFTMYAFLKLGFMQEATEFMKWVGKYSLKGEMHLVYTIDGAVPPEEVTLDHFSGYKNSKPVRVGNNAVSQKQMDIYGELIDTIYLYDRHVEPVTYDFWQHLSPQIEYVCEHWMDEDQGIWEVRGGGKEFLHSRLMCWVALDRAIKIAERHSFPYPRNKWNDIKDTIYHHIYSDFWNDDKQSFVQYKGATALDASVLLMPLVLFISPKDPRWVSTFEAIERELRLDVLIYRYRNQESHVDGLDGEEGTFTMCSFWYIECLAKMGRVEAASEAFAKITGYGNSLRLFSEQLSNSGRQVGNFPQALTHLALISAAYELDYQMESMKKMRLE